MKAKRWIIYVVIILLVILALFLIFEDQIRKNFFKPTDSSVETGINQSEGDQIETVAQDLTVPWGIAFLADKDILVTERSGTLQRIGKDKQSHVIPGVEHIGEGGLLGIALDPEFKQNNRIYLYMTTKIGEVLTNRIERYTYQDGRLSTRQIILQNIPGEVNHDGGRIAFGPDKLLYVTTGDAGNPDNSQNTNSLAGKILRITADGQPAPGNPFANAVYSYGHRNPQGLAWDDKGQLWSTEHGRSGVNSGFDELNLIKPGANYGWPSIQGDETRPGMVKPVVHSGPDETWAPAGLAYSQGSLFFGGLRGETLYEAKISANNSVTLKAHFRNDYGRLRTTVVNVDYLYFTTSNTDGRGTPKPNDDKVIRISLSVFR